MNFEEYLVSKKIDGQAFLKAEPDLFNTWKNEFDQMHANSFTVQKLNLINPVRRKYQLKEVPIKPPVNTSEPVSPSASPSPAASPAKPGKPVIKPKPKFN